MTTFMSMMFGANLCNCTRVVQVENVDYDTGEMIYTEETRPYDTEDIDIARFRCLKCGAVGYYSGNWAAFFLKGEPCPGSDTYFPNGPIPPPRSCSDKR